MALLGNLTGSAQYFNDDDFYAGVATQSARFDLGSSAYLTKTPDSAGNQALWTASMWIKRTGLTNDYFFGTQDGGSSIGSFSFATTGKLIVNNKTGGTGCVLNTDMAFRDTSAWYHLVVVYKGDEAAAANRTKIYVNGSQVATTVTEAGGTGNGFFNAATATGVGRVGSYTSNFLDGYLADVNVVDGLGLDPSYFGETKNGIWIAKKPVVSDYGTNGFRLQFAQVGVGTASTSTIGADTSGKTNHFTSSGIVASDCAMPDSPENNFCTWNPLTIGAQGTLAEGNLKNASFWSADLSGNASTFFPESGKWYWELRVDVGGTYPYIGITSQEKIGYSVNGGTFYNIAWPAGGTGQGTGSSLGTITKENIPSFADNDIMSFALDCDARKIWVAENNTYADSGDPANGSGENASWTVDVGVSPVIMGYNGQGVGTVANFGQDDTFGGAISSAGNTDGNGKGVFKYAPPSGFLALCTANLPEPTIGANSDTQADDYFNTVLYTGNGDARTISGVGFQPDWVWLKSRSTTGTHVLTDSVRGGNKQLFSNLTNAEASSTIKLTGFASDGFTLGADDGSGTGDANYNGTTYASWNWKANGGTTSSNTDGSITSTVQANTTAGFSIVLYNGEGDGQATVGHGLGVKPQVIIPKNRSTTGSYHMYHEAIDASAPQNYGIILNSTNARTDDHGFHNDTAPTSSVFTIGTYNNFDNDYVAYCFAEVEGYSKFGSYTGNGNADGTFVYLGFRPAWIMTKVTSAGNQWQIHDNKRNTSNVANKFLIPNATNAENTGTGVLIDFLSNGFKIYANGNSINANAATYIYMAFAEQPFKYANAR